MTDVTSGLEKVSAITSRVVAGLLLGFILLAGGLWLTDVVIMKNKLPHGTIIAGVDVGGDTHAQARDALAKKRSADLSAPVTIVAGDMTATLDPIKAGLMPDWEATVEQVPAEPVAPWSIIATRTSVHEYPIVTSVSDEKLEPVLIALAKQLSREVTNGDVRIEHGKLIVTKAIRGQSVDQGALRRRVTSQWLGHDTIVVPVKITEPVIDQKEVDRITNGPAANAVAGDLVVHGQGGHDGVIPVSQIDRVIQIMPLGKKLEVTIDDKAAKEILSKELKKSEKTARNARIDIDDDDTVEVKEKSVDGRALDWPAILDHFEDRVTGTAPKTWDAVYQKLPALFTTEQAKAAHFRDVLGSFSTGGFSKQSGKNIARAAALIDGTVVLPGDTFSFNEVTGPRTAQRGFVESGVLKNGHATSQVGAGVSQLATTLFNAVYLAGLEDVGHTPFPYYVDRFPPGRDAMVTDGGIDLKFRNSNPEPVLLVTYVTSKRVMVTVKGVKAVRVSSKNGGRWDETDVPVKKVDSSDCFASPGQKGFRTVDTRTITDLDGVELSRVTTQTVYDPIPKIICTHHRHTGDHDGGEKTKSSRD